MSNSLLIDHFPETGSMFWICESEVCPDINLRVLLCESENISMLPGDGGSQADGQASYKGLIWQLKWALQAEERHGILIQMVIARHANWTKSPSWDVEHLDNLVEMVWWATAVILARSRGIWEDPQLDTNQENPDRQSLCARRRPQARTIGRWRIEFGSSNISGNISAGDT